VHSFRTTPCDSLLGIQLIALHADTSAVALRNWTVIFMTRDGVPDFAAEHNGGA
jgi:hypothetical protein